ncbi:ATPase inhibitor subunit zeta [Microvirga sp. VF16]|uniref:DUF1476 domain-containing protein n=1 Tax=Microvirga sp. VF16 TaxID=2807101 RepID=UPI00193D1E9D|nr:ATPase inhibitor subunit zeta [Microvirga sp. VF16]QRM35708.1 DUF1476 family protein [Microvirga sp. VF16]
MNVTGTTTFNQSSPSWCLDADTRDSVIARRNVLAGLWAGRLLGLSNADLSSYATEVHQADFEVDGDDDIVGKITRDLSARGLPFFERHVRDKLRTYHREAFRQVAVTD